MIESLDLQSPMATTIFQTSESVDQLFNVLKKLNYFDNKE